MEFMYATGPLIVAGEFVYRLRAAEPVEVQVAVRCIVECDGYHAHFYSQPRFGHAPEVEVIHDFMSWDLEETEPRDPVIVGRRITSALTPQTGFVSVEAAFAELLPGVSVPAVDCWDRAATARLTARVRESARAAAWRMIADADIEES